MSTTDMELSLRECYRAFNARDLDVALELMDPEVDWPSAWEGGRVRGRPAVAGYWRRQFETISSRVEPKEFSHDRDGSVTVTVLQTVREAGSGVLISEGLVRHRYRFEDGLIRRMDVLED